MLFFVLFCFVLFCFVFSSKKSVLSGPGIFLCRLHYLEACCKPVVPQVELGSKPLLSDGVYFWDYQQPSNFIFTFGTLRYFVINMLLD